MKVNKLYLSSRISSSWVYRNTIKEIYFYDNIDNQCSFNSFLLTALVKESKTKISIPSDIDESDLEKAKFILSKNISNDNKNV
jgi:hypothetical protein